MVAPYQTEMVFLCSCLPWRTVAGAGAADRVAALPQIQRFLFVAELALAHAHLFVAMVVPVGGSAGGGGFCGVLPFRLSVVVVILDCVGPCQETG